MNLSSHQKYELTLLGDSLYSLSHNGVVCKFSAPATSVGVSKLYAVCKKSKLLYVGISKQSISARLRSGLKAIGKNGYWGYKWKEEREELNFHVFTICDQGTDISTFDMEAIEAEVVYLCRAVSGQWPTAQNEIHFQVSSDIHRDVAQAIFQIIGK